MTFNGDEATEMTWSASSIVSNVVSGITAKSDKGTKSEVASNGKSAPFSVRPPAFLIRRYSANVSSCPALGKSIHLCKRIHLELSARPSLRQGFSSSGEKTA